MWTGITAVSTFTIRKPKPSETRASFCIFRVERENGKRKAKALEIPELELVNKRYLDGTLAFEEALALVSKLREKEAKKVNGPKHKPVTNSENQKLLRRYWDQEYTYRELIAPTAMWNDLTRAIRCLGDTPLLTVGQKELHVKINSLGYPPNKRRRVISRINQLLKFAGRDFHVRLPKQEFLEIKYLTLKEVQQLADSLGEMDKHLTLLAFATGCRVGELFGITQESIKRPRIIHIGHQIRKDGTKGNTKNGKARNIRMLEIGEKSLAYWLKVPMAERLAHRNRRLSEIIKDKSKEIWKQNPDKHVKFHDLRHSYAIEMLRQLAPLTQVAQLLGDSLQVCQTYYTGFSMVDESLDALDERLTKQFKISSK